MLYILVGDSLRVAIVYTTPFSEIASTESETVMLPVATVTDLVGVLAKRFGPKFEETLIDSDIRDIRPGMVILLNGHRCDLSTKLEDGDEVGFLMAMAGG